MEAILWGIMLLIAVGEIYFSWFLIDLKNTFVALLKEKNDEKIPD